MIIIIIDDKMYCSIQYDKDGKLIPVVQHLNYAYRCNEHEKNHPLAHLNLIEYVSIIKIIDKPSDDKLPSTDSNAIFDFSTSYSLYGKKVQQLKQKFSVPMLGGAPPPRFPFTSHNHKLFKRRANAFASYIMNIILPWDLKLKKPVYKSCSVINYETFCKWCMDCNDRNASFIDKTRYYYVNNIAKNLVEDVVHKKAFSQFRSRNATTWNKTDFEMGGMLHGYDGIKDFLANEDIDHKAALGIDEMISTESFIQCLTDKYEKTEDKNSKEFKAKNKLIDKLKATSDYLNDVLGVSDNYNQKNNNNTSNLDGNFIESKGIYVNKYDTSQISRVANLINKKSIIEETVEPLHNNNIDVDSKEQLVIGTNAYIPNEFQKLDNEILENNAKLNDKQMNLLKTYIDNFKSNHSFNNNHNNKTLPLKTLLTGGPGKTIS
jgi:hypothetical protein